MEIKTNFNYKDMTTKDHVLELYPTAKCVVEHTEESKDKDKRFIVCRNICENEIEKLSIAEKSYKTANEAWEGALTYLQNKQQIEKLQFENLSLKLENLSNKNYIDEVIYQSRKNTTRSIIFMSVLGGICIYMTLKNI